MRHLPHLSPYGAGPSCCRLIPEPDEAVPPFYAVIMVYGVSAFYASDISGPGSNGIYILWRWWRSGYVAAGEMFGDFQRMSNPKAGGFAVYFSGVLEPRSGR